MSKMKSRRFLTDNSLLAPRIQEVIGILGCIPSDVPTSGMPRALAVCGVCTSCGSCSCACECYCKEACSKKAVAVSQSLTENVT